MADSDKDQHASRLAYSHTYPSARIDSITIKYKSTKMKFLRIILILTWEDPVSCLADRKAISGPLSGNVAWKISPVFTLKP